MSTREVDGVEFKLFDDGSLYIERSFYGSDIATSLNRNHLEVLMEMLGEAEAAEKPVHTFKVGDWVLSGGGRPFRVESLGFGILHDIVGEPHHVGACSPIPAPRFEVGDRVVDNTQVSGYAPLYDGGNIIDRLFVGGSVWCYAAKAENGSLVLGTGENWEIDHTPTPAEQAVTRLRAGLEIEVYWPGHGWLPDTCTHMDGSCPKPYWGSASHDALTAENYGNTWRHVGDGEG